MHKLLRSLLIFVSFVGLVQCGEDGDNSKVDFEIDPESPVVINADLTLNPGQSDEVVIIAPWFRYGFNVANNSDKVVTVQSLIFHVSAMTNSGLVKTDIEIDPGDFGLTRLAEIAAGATTTVPADFYAYGLPDGAIGFRYTINVEVMGWFGPETAPEKRLQKTYAFTTK